jgi:hypothetical protein
MNGCPATRVASFGLLLAAAACGGDDVGALPPPMLVVDEREIDFHDVFVGSVDRFSVQFENGGGRPLTITALTPGTPWSDEFQWDGPQPPIVIEPDDALTVRILYHPRTEGADEARLVIGSDDPFVPEFTLILRGRGVPRP